MVPVLQDRAANADTPWQERPVLPELINYLSRDRAADSNGPRPVARTKEKGGKKSWWSWGRDKKTKRSKLPPIRSADSTTLSAVREIWQRIERWLETNAPPRVLRGLAPPASEEDIANAEDELGYRFPADFRASLFIHDGERKDVGSIKGLRLNSLKELLVDWRTMEELLRDGEFSQFGDEVGPTGLKPGHWNRGWVPVASDGGGNSYSMDLDPGGAGTAGQMFFFDHEQGPGTVEAKSLLEWLGHYADELEAGRVRVRAGGLASAEDDE